MPTEGNLDHKRSEAENFIRFALVGIAANAAGFSAYAAATYLGASPKAAMTVLYCVGATLSFWANRRWVFRSAAGRLSAVRFILVYLGGYAIDWLVLHNWVDRLGYSHLIVQGVAVAFIAVYLYLGLRYFVFPNRYAKRYVRA